MSKRHEISSSPENMVWGYIDSTSKPVLEVASGDTVTLHSFPAGGKESLPADRSCVPADYMAALDTMVQGPGPRFITGPIFVKDAEPGDVLQVDILDVKVNQDWGFVAILPMLGTLPDEFTDYETIHPVVDHERNVCVMPWAPPCRSSRSSASWPSRCHPPGAASARRCRAPSAATWITRSSNPARRSTYP